MSVLEADRQVMIYQCEEVIAAQLEAARRTVCSLANSSTEAREILQILGLLEPAGE